MNRYLPKQFHLKAMITASQTSLCRFDDTGCYITGTIICKPFDKLCKYMHTHTHTQFQIHIQYHHCKHFGRNTAEAKRNTSKYVHVLCFHIMHRNTVFMPKTLPLPKFFLFRSSFSLNFLLFFLQHTGQLLLFFSSGCVK